MATIKNNFNFPLNLRLDIAQFDNLHLVIIHILCFRPLMMAMTMTMTMAMIPRVSGMRMMSWMSPPTMSMAVTMTIMIIICFSSAIWMLNTECAGPLIWGKIHSISSGVVYNVHFEDNDIRKIIILNRLMIIKQLRFRVYTQNLGQFQTGTHMTITLS